MGKRMIAVMLLSVSMAAVVWGCGDKDAGEGEPKEEAAELSDAEADNEKADKADEEDTPAKLRESGMEKSELETSSEEETSEKILSEKMIQSINTAKTRHYYADILSGLYWAGELTDMQVEVNDDFYDTVRNNRFAVMDIDNDGREELIISYSAASMAGMFEVVYDYDPAANQLKQQLCAFPSISFYDNGIVKEEDSHNHSPGEFWPYTLYQYQADSDTYVMAAYVNTWSREYADTYWDGQPFPEQLDVDGDGILYSIQLGDNPTFEYDNYKYNQSDYDVFYQSMMQSTHDAGTAADEIQVDYKPLTYESFQEYTPAYLKLMHEAGQREADADQTDIGFLFLEEGYTLDEIEQFLADEYGVAIELQDEEYGDFAIGLYKDKQVFDFVNLDGGDLTYLEEKVEDITVFGVYPGMDRDKAWERLTAYGFYANPDGEMEDSLITGVGMGNRSIYFEVEDNKIDRITIRPYCKYTG